MWGRASSHANILGIYLESLDCSIIMRECGNATTPRGGGQWTVWEAVLGGQYSLCWTGDRSDDDDDMEDIPSLLDSLSLSSLSSRSSSSASSLLSRLFFFSFFCGYLRYKDTFIDLFSACRVWCCCTRPPYKENVLQLSSRCRCSQSGLRTETRLSYACPV